MKKYGYLLLEYIRWIRFIPLLPCIVMANPKGSESQKVSNKLTCNQYYCLRNYEDKKAQINYILFQGTIPELKKGGIELADQIKHLISTKEMKSKKFVFVLSSPGGDLGTSYKIRDIIKASKSDITTYLPPNGYCASSCITILASSKKRIGSDSDIVSFHQCSDETESSEEVTENYLDKIKRNWPAPLICFSVERLRKSSSERSRRRAPLVRRFTETLNGEINQRGWPVTIKQDIPESENWINAFKNEKYPSFRVRTSQLKGFPLVQNYNNNLIPENIITNLIKTQELNESFAYGATVPWSTNSMPSTDLDLTNSSEHPHLLMPPSLVYTEKSKISDTLNLNNSGVD